jgi:hypothetical protein
MAQAARLSEGSRAYYRIPARKTDTITASPLRSLQRLESSNYRYSKGVCHHLQIALASRKELITRQRRSTQPARILSRKNLPLPLSPPLSIPPYRLVSSPSSAKRPSVYFISATRRSRMSSERVDFAGFRTCRTMSRTFTYAGCQ